MNVVDQVRPRNSVCKVIAGGSRPFGGTGIINGVRTNIMPSWDRQLSTYVVPMFILASPLLSLCYESLSMD
jgi:hypothetical protein